MKEKEREMDEMRKGMRRRFFARVRVRERFSSIKLRKINKNADCIAATRANPGKYNSLIFMSMTGDGPCNSFGSADSIKNYDYYRTRNRKRDIGCGWKKRRFRATAT